VHETLTTPKSNREKSKNQSKTIGDKAKTVEMKPTFLDDSKAKKADPCQNKSCQLTSKKDTNTKAIIAIPKAQSSS
jgi:hypothetical protein